MKNDVKKQVKDAHLQFKARGLRKKPTLTFSSWTSRL